MPPGHIDYMKALKQAETFKTGHEDKRPARRLAEYCIASLMTERNVQKNNIMKAKQYAEADYISYFLQIFLY